MRLLSVFLPFSTPPPHLSGALLLSLSGLLFQLAVTRITSAALNYHLAFFVISAALLGTGAGGVWVAMKSRDVALLPLAVGSAAGMAAAGAAAFWLPLSQADGAAVLTGLLVVYPVLAFPFFCQSAVFATLLRQAGRHSGVTYAAVLVGAALGVCLSPIVFGLVGPPWALVVAGVASIVAAASFGSFGRWWFLIALVPGIAVATVLFQPFSPNVLRTKPLAVLLDPISFPDSQLLATTWDSTSRVDVFESPGAPLLWGTRGAGLVGLPGGPQARGITIDADALTAALRANGEDDASVVFNLATSAPYALAPRERVLVIGPGGGVDVEAALAYGARHVDAVEVNRGVVNAMLGPLASYTGDLYRRPGVRLTVEDGRNFVRRAPPGSAYDAIVLTAVDSWAAVGAGAYSLAENYLYTAEAFQEYYDLLAPGGVLAVSRWYSAPPRELARLTHMAALAIEERGENPARSLLLIRSGQFGSFGTLLVRKGAFPMQEVAAARSFVRAKGFALAYDPVLNAASFRDLYVDDFPAGEPPWRARLATDDRPFFFDFTSWSDIFRGRVLLSRLPLGHSVLLVTLIQSAILAAAVMVLPFRRLKAYPLSGGLVAPGAYFLLIGFGFMFAEMAFLQRMMLLLGHPTPAFVVTLAGMLLGAGIGSAWSTGRTVTAGRLLAAGVMLVLLASKWPAMTQVIAGHALHWRAALALAVVGSTAFLVGGALPSGLRAFWPTAAGGPIADDRVAPHIPWAWGINGTASVLGASLAVMLSMDAGLAAVMGIAGSCYLVAALLSWHHMASNNWGRSLQ